MRGLAGSLERIELDDLDAEAASYDAVVASTPDIDHFCSSSDWVIPAHETFHPEQEPWILRSESTWLVMGRGRIRGLGRYLSPLEAMWGLASPVLGAEPMRAAREVYRALDRQRHRWDALWLSGLRPYSPAFTTLAMLFGRRDRLFLGPTTERHVASLDGGFDGFLSRRSAKFRANLRRARRKAHEGGIEIEYHDRPVDEPTRRALYRRVLEVDARSWKGLHDQGMEAGGLAEFYERMTRRLAPRGRLRVIFLRHQGADVAMAFGALFDDHFRGLQMSFDESYRRWALGNVVQAEFIDRLAEEGARFYDLGSDIAYKRRWAEPGLETAALVVRQ